MNSGQAFGKNFLSETLKILETACQISVTKAPADDEDL